MLVGKSHMSAQRYIVITVAYDGRPRYGRSLAWIAPELRNAGLVMTRDHIDASPPSRTWAGTLDEVVFRAFARAWHLDEAPHSVRAHDRDGAVRVYTLDGMNWEVEGQAPIAYVQFEVWERRPPTEPPAPRSPGRIPRARGAHLDGARPQAASRTRPGGGSSR